MNYKCNKIQIRIKIRIFTRNFNQICVRKVSKLDSEILVVFTVDSLCSNIFQYYNRLNTSLSLKRKLHLLNNNEACAKLHLLYYKKQHQTYLLYHHNKNELNACHNFLQMMIILEHCYIDRFSFQSLLLGRAITL